jgi:DNA polymerase-3 subunit delta'
VLAERPCGHCRSCTLISAGRHPDLRLVSGEVTARGITTLKIDQIRQLQHELSLTSIEARYKVAIIEQFEAANQNAANAFLKTLEEPPNNVLLILTAADADTLLPTISSRCQNIGLRLVPTSLIEQTLINNLQLPDHKARLYAHLADGRIGWAIQVAQAPDLLELRQTHLTSLYEALDSNRVGRFTLAQQLTRKPEALPEMLRTWLSWWRDLALLSISQNNAERLTNIDQESTILNKVSDYIPAEVFSSLTNTSQAIWQLSRNANTRLVIENLLLHYPINASVR